MTDILEGLSDMCMICLIFNFNAIPPNLVQLTLVGITVSIRFARIKRYIHR